MRTCYVFKAQDIDPSKPIPSVTIVIDERFPDAATLQEATDLFERQAAGLADALCSVLPGGTLCRLTAELLRCKATSLVVPRDT